MTDEVFGLELPDDFIQVYKALEAVGYVEFLEQLKVREALKIVSAENEEARHAIKVRVLLIDELSNFTKSLFRIDTNQ